MFLYELFAPHYTSMKSKLRNSILDILMPLSSHEAKEISIEMLISRLKTMDFGIEITPDIIRDCVDPNNIPFVSDIDDKTIYLNGTSRDESEEAEGENMGMPEEPADPVGDNAKKQATSSMKPKRPPIKNEF